MTGEKEPTRRKRSWKRRLVRLAFLMAVLLIGLRIALPYALPSVLNSLVADAGWTLRYGYLNLSLLSGTVQIGNLELFERDEAGEPVPEKPVAQLEYARVDLDLGSVLGGTLRFNRVDIDGLDVWLESDAQGDLVLPAGVVPDTERAELPVPQTESAEQISFTPPVSIGAAQLQRVRVHGRDPHREDAVDRWVEATLRLTDLGGPTPTRLELKAYSPNVVDVLTLEAHGRIESQKAEIALALDVRGLRPHNAHTWLRALGLEPQADLMAASLQGTLRAHAPSAPDLPASETVVIDAELSRMHVTADQEEQAAFKSARVTLELAPDRTLFRDVTIDGLRGNVTLSKDGGLQLAGLRLPPTPSEESLRETTEPGIPLQLEAASLTAIALHLRDETVAPPADIRFLGNRLEMTDLLPEESDRDGTLVLEGQLPGIAEELAVHGQVEPFGETRSLDLDIRAGGITLRGLKSYFREMDLEPHLQDGQLELHVTARARTDGAGTTRGTATIEDLSFTDGDPLLRIDRAHVGDLLAEPGLTRLDDVELRGVDLPLVRDSAGVVHLLGLHNLQTSLRRAGQAARAVEAAAQRQAGRESRFELASLTVRQVGLRVRDDLLGAVLGPDNVSIDLQNLAFGGEAVPGGPGDEAQLSLRLAGALAEDLEITGSMTTHPGPLDFTAALRVEGSGLHLTRIEPYLRQLGIEPRVQNGQIQASLTAHARLDENEGLEFGASLSDVALSTPQNPDGFSFGSLSVEGGSIRAEAVHVEQITLEAPVVRAVRQEDGRLRVAGLVFSPPIHGEAPSDATPVTASARVEFVVDKLGLNGGRFEWHDETMTPPVVARLTADASAERLNTGPGATPVPVTATLVAEGAIASATLEGEVALDPADLRAKLHVDVQGISDGPFHSYLPAGVTSRIQDGHLTGDVQARLATGKEGGQAVELLAQNFVLRNAGVEAPLLQLEALRVIAPRIDPEGRVYQFSEISTHGLELTAQRHEDATLSALGLRIGTARQPAKHTADVGAVAATAPRAAVPPAPPQVLVDKLDLELSVSLSEPGGKPLDLGLHLTNPEPLLLLDEYPDGLNPLRLELAGTASPLVDEFAIDLQAIPWTSEARLEVDVKFTGIHGEALGDVMPSIASSLGAEDLQDGELSARVQLVSDLRRRGPLDLDTSRPFGLDFTLENLALLASPDGEVLLGVEDVFLHATRISPDGAYISSLDVDGLRGRARRDEDGLHIAGLTLRPGAAPAGTEASPERVGGAEAGPQPSQPSPQQSPQPSPDVSTSPEDPFEIVVERLTSSGLDFEYRDTTSDPPLHIPLDGLDIEVEDFSSLAFSHSVPVTFSVSLTAGTVPLPVREESAGLVRDIVSTAGNMVGATGDVQLEERLLMEELSAQGRMVLFPSLEGRFRVSLTGLELTALRGLAGDAGVKIGDGVLDAGIDNRFEGKRGVFTDVNLTFAHLALEESSDGPISTYLRLPAPTNTVIFLLKNDQDEVVIPLSFHTDETGIASGAIYREAISAFRSMVTDAIAASPFRIGGAVTGTVTGLLSGIGDLFGIGGGESEPGSGPPPVSITFSPADLALSSAAKKTLDGIAGELRRDRNTTAILRHDFGPADLDRAAILANPSTAQSLSLVTSLRQRRAELIRTRAEAAADARVHHALGRVDEAEQSTRRLQNLDNDLAQTEDSLDRVLQLLRPNADRRADQRTRTAALAIGDGRIQAVRQYLIDITDPAFAHRIETRRARMRSVLASEDQEEPPLGQVTVTTRRRRL